MFTGCSTANIETINTNSGDTPSPSEPPSQVTVLATSQVVSAVTISQPPTTTPQPTSTQQPEPTLTPTLASSPTATPIGPCDIRIPSEDQIELVTLKYGISREYWPLDLVNINDHLPVSVTLGYPTQVREIVIVPLVEMVSDMIEQGLQPQIISGYRSYSAQVITWNKWLEEYPDRADIVSAPPGHSEHQLGTTLDFGSPELAILVGDNDIEFHTSFYKTSEGQWLAENAYKYGFTLSFTVENFKLSGLYYEPWHFRYIGTKLARYLEQNDISLIEYLTLNQAPPCIAEE